MTRVISGYFRVLRFPNGHCAECPGWVASRRWTAMDEFHGLNGGK